MEKPRNITKNALRPLTLKTPVLRIGILLVEKEKWMKALRNDS
jgi:hypothetical protein